MHRPSWKAPSAHPAFSIVQAAFAGDYEAMHKALHGRLHGESEHRALEALTIAAPPAVLRQIASFLDSCADEIEANDPTCYHRKLRDEAAPDPIVLDLPDIEVSRLV